MVGWVLRRISSVLQGKCQYSFLRQGRVNPLRWRWRFLLLSVERLLLLAKNTRKNSGAQCLHLHQDLPTHLTFRMPFLPFDTLSLTIYTLRGWKFSVLCNSASCRMSFWALLSRISAQQLEEILFSFRVDVDVFRSVIQYLSWVFKSLT